MACQGTGPAGTGRRMSQVTSEDSEAEEICCRQEEVVTVAATKPATPRATLLLFKEDRPPI